MGRKDKPVVSDQGNLGAVTGNTPHSDTSSSSVTMPERLLRLLVKESFAFLSNGSEEAKDYLSYFFDSTVTEKEQESLVLALTNNPPNVVLGFPRSGMDPPTIAILLATDDEQERYLADFIRETGEESLDSEPTSHRGSHWLAVYTIYIMAQNPDYVVFLYHILKAILISGRFYLYESGVTEMKQLQGGELRPETEYPGENMFSRTLNVPMLVPASVPRALGFDMSRGRLHVYVNDVTVDGLVGRVTPVSPKGST